MAKAGKCSYDLVCNRHGIYSINRGKVKVLGVEPTSKKKNVCPLCRKEYISRYNIKNTSGIDWRYVDLKEEE